MYYYMIDWITSKLSFTASKKKNKNDYVIIPTKNNSIRITIHEKDIESQQYEYHSNYSVYRYPEQYITMKIF